MAEPERNEPTPQQDRAAPDPPDAPAPPGPPGPGAAEGRRGAIRLLVTIGGLAYAGALAVPAARFLADPGGASASGERWIRVARLADLPEGEPRRLAVEGDERDAFTVTRGQILGSVWIERRGDTVRALSATCPHLGCAVDRDASGQGFACPCHTSRFGPDGEAIAGPSPRGMDPLAARIAGEWVEVDFRRFRQGVADRREAST
jgi:menaquinol-cytochrome c reductase iron-sulfur subunit